MGTEPTTSRAGHLPYRRYLPTILTQRYEFFKTERKYQWADFMKHITKFCDNELKVPTQFDRSPEAPVVTV